MDKILIANRGEIALRIVKTCKKLGISTVAIYSEADREASFVKEADESFLIGPPPVQQSYLQADELIRLALQSGAQAIHPGYGFLSENAGFARKVREAGLIFIGPDEDTIERMGDKIESRKTMSAAGVPVVPGTDDGVASLDEALDKADEIGYPVMLKASSGGGGIGMVLCQDEQALSQQFQTVKNRAKAYFGDDVVFLEKYIENARHIEVQIFGDNQGNIVHLFERNCSVQRRNQKVIEESPSPSLSADAREKLFSSALEAAKAVHYKNAGTVEFIVGEDDNFYFLEMNTRLQVEHPITEEVTGLDLVEWQIEVAKGNPLPIADQNAIRTAGHAIEYRIYAEDPNTFMPSPGSLQKLDWGNTDQVRIDAGYREGDQVTPFYDPMIAKVIIHAEDREQAIEHSNLFFAQVGLEGLKTNLPLLSEFIESKEFKQGNYHTKVLSEWLKQHKGELAK
ncbi:acetyl/propionyl/methylcrotonyl-CoA carboxylase subunit alpha [Sporosarcina sp. Te-1]|uniref:acetyl-CoA carboxylase biotin carboxylase subunit n=1 Tax=Sporosarcina sp. Te-1 TaxID=2818390 RepID=UPI001A9DCD73|nr:acetyl-CoA carboxylase biotin carboxylase subunit [Sporosarcina sp. Te-1]QTD43332.1 acetyl-CoA carboxylase biotin carboxylase subunit [Sporosarcina sp. Te-1]